MVSLCVELVGNLSRIIELGLALETDTASNDDFDSTPLIYMFTSGEVTGEIRCNNIEISRDGIVENTERFIARLSENSPADDVNLPRNVTEIRIEDSPQDSMFQILVHSFYLCIVFFCNVSLFDC